MTDFWWLNPCKAVDAEAVAQVYKKINAILQIHFYFIHDANYYQFVQSIF